MKDLRIQELIAQETTRQVNGVELIASENYASKEVIETIGNVFNNKYAEGYPGKRYYGGCNVADEVESLAIERLNTLFGCEYSNVQPHSGAQANAAIFLALLQAGDSILGFDLSHGGHLSHGSHVNFSGKMFDANFYGVEADTGLIDMDKVADKANQVKPKLIVCGASAYSQDWDYARFREIADSVGAILLADIAHPAGMIATGILNDPMPHCHIVSTTTHKTLRGPRGGVIMMGKDFENPWGRTTKKGNPIMMSNVLNMGVFPGMQGGPLMHVIAAKAVAFHEANTPAFKTYTQQVVSNAKAMAETFSDLGYKIISGGTSNHLMLLDLRHNLKISGKVADAALGKAHITVNKNMVPFDDKSPFVTSGIRIGTPAITSRGLIEADCIQIVEWIDGVLKNTDNDTFISDIKAKVEAKMSQYSIYPTL